MFANSPGASFISKFDFVSRFMGSVATHAGPETGDIIFMVSGLIGLILSTSCFALRTSTTRQNRSLRQPSSVHILVLAIFFLACAFCTSTLFLYFGVGIFNDETCRSAVVLCLVFYLGEKYTLYLFLVERTHITRGVLRPRMADPVYLAGLSFVLVGFTGIGIWTFIPLMANYTSVCHIGLHKPVAAAILAWDVFLNLFLTLVFLHHIRKFLVDGLTMTITPVPLRRALRRGAEDPTSTSGMVFVPHESLLHVIRKTFWGCIGILLSSVTNLAFLLAYTEGEDVWLCFTLCTVDVSWAVIIIFWLTKPAADTHSNNTSLNQVQASTSCFRSGSVHSASAG